MIAHLAVILAEGDAGVDRRLARRHRHGGCVADDDGAVHQRAAGRRILDAREFLDGFHDLARTLAAGNDQNDIHPRMLGQRMLQHRLAGAEGAGDAGSPAARDREEGVDGAHRRDHWLVRIEPLGRACAQHVLGQRAAHRPALGQVDRALLAPGIADARDRGVERHAPFLDPGDLDLADLIERHHDLVREAAFRDGAEQAAGPQARTLRDDGDEGPFALSIQRIEIHATRQKDAVLDGDLVERALQTVVNLAEQARAEDDRQHLAGLLDRVADGDAARVFEHLDVCGIATHPQDFGLEPFLASVGGGPPRQDEDHLVLHQ